MGEKDLLQMALEVLITVGLPILLTFLVKFLNVKISQGKTAIGKENLEFAVTIVRQLVMAAEMNGLSGALKNIGEEKKRFVFDLAEAELARKGIKLDLDVLDALIEAQVKEAIKDLEPLVPEATA